MRRRTFPRPLCVLLTFALQIQLAAADGATTFSARELREDLAALKASIDRIHPASTHSVSDAELTRALTSVSKQLDRPMTPDEAWRVMSTLNPVMADGHMVVSPPENAAVALARHLRAGGRLFPYNVQIAADGELYVRTRLNGDPTDLQGARIESIDGMTGREISERLLAHLNGDTPQFRAALLSMRFPFLYWKIFGDKVSYRLRIRGVEALIDGGVEIPPAYSQHAFDELFRFELINARQAVMTIDEFYWEDKAKFYEFTKSAFARMHAVGTQTLIIDIRANTGGDDDMWLEGIMPYIASKPFRNGSDYISKGVEGRQQEGQRIGEVIHGSQSTWYQPSLDDPLRFTGKVYVLIGPATYSSSILFTTAVQDYGFATVAGTGGAARASQSGGTQRTTLPHTKIGVVMPRFILKRASGEEGLVQPDVLIPEDPFRPEAAIESLLRR